MIIFDPHLSVFFFVFVFFIVFPSQYLIVLSLPFCTRDQISPHIFNKHNQLSKTKHVPPVFFGKSKAPNEFSITFFDTSDFFTDGRVIERPLAGRHGGAFALDRIEIKGRSLEILESALQSGGQGHVRVLFWAKVFF